MGKDAGVVPRGRWYIEAGQGMGEDINMAKELKGYALTDFNVNDHQLFLSIFIYE